MTSGSDSTFFESLAEGSAMSRREVRRGAGPRRDVPAWWTDSEQRSDETTSTPGRDLQRRTGQAPEGPDEEMPARQQPWTTEREPLPTDEPHEFVAEEDTSSVAGRAPSPPGSTAPIPNPPWPGPRLEQRWPTSTAADDVPAAPDGSAISSSAAVDLRQPFPWTLSEQTAAVPGQDPLWLPNSARTTSPAPEAKPRRWRRRAKTRPAQQARTSGRLTSVQRPLAAYEPLGVGEASGFARRFASDYLSWDEDEPARRAAALRTYLADPDTADGGWSGTGRQRVEETIAGRTVEYRGAVVVEVTARIVVFRRTAAAPDVWGSSSGEITPPLAFAPASAPAPTAPGWEPGAAWWVQVAPPVRRHHDGRLVIDLGLDLSDPAT